MIQRGSQFLRAARDVAWRRRRQSKRGRFSDVRAGLGDRHAIHQNKATFDQIKGARAGGRKTSLQDSYIKAGH
jgi:hypothetical protein